MKVFKLVTKVMEEIGHIGKDRKNLQQGYQFRGIDDMYNAIYPAFCKHGLFTVPTVLESTREERASKTGGVLIYTTVKVSYKLFADDGSFVEAVCIGEGMDSGDKSANKAMAAAHKYFFMQTFCIPTEEVKDSEVDSPEPLPKKKVPIKEPVEPTLEGQRIADLMSSCKTLEDLAKTWSSEQKVIVTLPKNTQLSLMSIKEALKTSMVALK